MVAGSRGHRHGRACDAVANERPHAPRRWPRVPDVAAESDEAFPPLSGPRTRRGSPDHPRHDWDAQGSLLPEGGTRRGTDRQRRQPRTGRIADIGPALDEFGETPLFGQGYATRGVQSGLQKAQILDDQWLGNLLETGVLGTFGWVWLFWRAIRRFGGRAKRDPSSDGWLAAALTASVLTFAVGMFTFDAFAFVQVTLMLFILVALGAAMPQMATPRAADRAG